MKRGSRGDEDESCFFGDGVSAYSTVAPRRHLLLDCLNGPFMVNR